jgi:HlyD family secretion protein
MGLDEKLQVQKSAPATGGPSGVQSTEDILKTIGAKSSRKGRYFRWLLYTGLICAAIAAVVLFRRNSGTLVEKYQATAAKLGNLQVTVRATGTLKAITTVEIGAEVSGRMTTATVDANDRVTTGQILAQIDTSELQSALDQAEAQVAVAQAAVRQSEVSLAEAELAFTRAQSLAKKQLVSREDLDTAQAARNRAAASVQSAKASLVLAKAQRDAAITRFDKATVRSTIDGIVMARVVEPGQTITAGFQTTVLFRLAQDLTQLRLNVDVDEADVGRVREGQTATFQVEAYPDQTFPSVVTSLRNDPKTTNNVVTYEAVLAVDNSQRLLRPGMTCTATITIEQLNGVLLIPNAALRWSPPEEPGKKPAPTVNPETRDKSQRTLWVLRDGKPIAVTIRVGASDGISTQVMSGELKPGDRVITDSTEIPTA